MGFTPPLPGSRLSQPLIGCFAFFRLVSLFHPTGTLRVPVFRVLRYPRSVSVSSTLCFPRCCCPFSAFFLGLRGLPCLVAASLSCAATSLRLGPSSLIALGPVSVLRFSSASELCSRLFRASPAARFHPCAVSALSLDLLSPFEVSGFSSHRSAFC